MEASKTNENQTVYDFIIAGAGISGLQAADILAQKQDLSFLILQAQSYAGGRIHSISVSELEESNKTEWARDHVETIKAAIVDKGAGWVEGRHSIVQQLCKQFGIVLRDRFEEGSTTILGADKPYTEVDIMNHPDYAKAIRSFLVAFDEAAMQYTKTVYSDMTVSSPQAKKILRKYDKMTLKEFLDETVPEDQRLVRDILECFFEHTESMKSSQNSMHEVLTKNAKSNDLGILKQFLGDFGDDPCYSPVGGVSSLISGFLASIEKKKKKPISDILKLKHQVITVDNRPKDHITILCQTEGGVQKKYRCKQLISAVPLAVTKFIAFQNLSMGKRVIIDNQIRTSAKKIFMVTKKPFWRRGKNGEIAASGDGLFSREYFVNMSVDISPPDQSCGIMVFFQHGDRLDGWESTFFEQDYEKKKKYLIDVMCKMFKVKPEDKENLFEGCFFSECSFMNNPHIRSGFQSLSRLGTFNQVLEIGDSLQALYRDEHGIIFIGTEYSLQFATFMEGAVRVAREKMYKLFGEKDPWAHLLVDNVLVH